MRIIHWNILEGAAERWQGCHTWLHQQQPDLLCLCECNGWTEASASERMQALGLPHVVLMATRHGFDLCCASSEPLTLLTAQTDGFWHGALHVKHPHFDILLTHLAPNCVPDAAALRRREAAGLLKLLTKRARPTIITGDFNDFAPADADWLREQGDPNDPNESPVADLLQAGYVDLGAGTQPCYTVPTAIQDHNWLRRIDFILSSPELIDAQSKSKIHQSPELDHLSDHYPVSCDLPESVT